MTKSNLKGFTLIELLIVIVIIGILAVALIPRLTGAQASARDAARKANTQQIVTAIEAFKAENNSNLPNLTSTGTAATALVGTYMQSFPKDPSNKATTFVTGGNGNYIVCTEMERTANNNSTTCDAAALAALTGGTLTAGAGTYFVSGQ